MSFIVYDLVLLGIFVIGIAFYLYKNRHRVHREGLMLLHKTSWGLKLIEKTGTKHQKLLEKLSYVSVFLGYLLMVGILYFVGKIIWVYAFQPQVVQAIKVPPIMPLIPYLPQAFHLSFLPPFYFTYWIIIIALIAVTHEFFHGIFAAKNKVRIKTTGFGFFPFFLPVFLAAFVELDEKQMAKKKIFDQMAVLSAGTFANVLTAILFLGVLWLFFMAAFVPAGVSFDTYPYTEIGLGTISMINGITINNSTYQNVLSLVKDDGLSNITSGNQNYLLTKSMLTDAQNVKDAEQDNKIFVYYDAPAINANLESIILKVDGQSVTDINKLAAAVDSHKPGDTITLTVVGEDGSGYNRDIVLGTNPQTHGAWLGIAFNNQQSSGLLGNVLAKLSSFKKPHVYYSPRFNGVSEFIYNLLWWIVIISISVALINMLPVGIFDGGRFFYLTILAITKKEKVAKSVFLFVTRLFLVLLVLLMILWAKAVYF